MMNTIFNSERQFVVWRYTNSMGRLHIRSLIDENNLTNIDIAFWSTVAMNLTTEYFEGLVISIQSNYKYYTNNINIYELKSKDHNSLFVNSPSVVIYENKLKYNQSILDLQDSVMFGNLLYPLND